MSNLCYSIWNKRFNAILKWNAFKFSVFLLISVVVVTVVILSRNHVRNIGADCSSSDDSSFCVFSSSSPANESPLCSGNLLDKRQIRYAKEAGGSCQLLHYTFQRAVGCFDALYERHYSDWNSPHILNHINGPDSKLHFAFIGDSRIRQQFFNFLKLIPDYDWESQPNPLPSGYHGDMEVTSDIIRLRLSFQWRPILNDTVIDTIRQWATASETNRPSLIVIGIAVWHMLHSEGADFKLYREKLKELAPFLGQLANVSRVIWLNQYPVIEKYGYSGAMNTDIFSEKIHRYNEAVTSELQQNYSGMRMIWDSSNILVEEYIRGCFLYVRRQRESHLFSDPDHSYINCLDFTHPGYSALSQATQLLFNDICNEFY